MCFSIEYFIGSSVMLFILLIISAYSYMTRNFNYWKKRGVAQIKPTPFIGNFGSCLLVKRSGGQWARDMYEWSNGLPYMGYYIFDKPFFLIRHPELIKNILVKDFNCFSDRFATASPFDRLGDASLIFMKNPRWKSLRSKLSPIYTSSKLKKMFELMVDIGKDLETYMESHNLKEKEITIIEIKELTKRFTIDTTSTTAFGIQSNCLNYPDSEFRKNGEKIFEQKLSRNFVFMSVFFAPQLVAPLGIKILPRDSANFLRSTMWSVINEREKLKTTRGDLIDILIELRNNKNNIFDDDDYDFDGDNLLSQALSFFIGGFETTSSALNFTLYEMAINIQIQNRLRADMIKELVKTDGKITYDLAMNLPYLDMVIAEVLRKYPSIPFLDRVANRDYKIPNSNLVLEKGTPVMIPTMGLHYDPEYFIDPEKFDPERFSEANKKTIKPFVYLPFGDGPHACIGMRIGILEIKVGLLTLIPKYEFTPSKKTLIPIPISAKSSLVTAVDGSLFLNVKKISTN